MNIERANPHMGAKITNIKTVYIEAGAYHLKLLRGLKSTGHLQKAEVLAFSQASVMRVEGEVWNSVSRSRGTVEL